MVKLPVSRNSLVVVYSVAATLVVTAVVLYFVAAAVRKSPTLKPEIVRQLNFTAYVASTDGLAHYQLDTKTVEFAPTTKTLTYTARGGGVDIVVTQQSLPEPFTDIPNYYEQMLNKLHQFKTINTAVGTVTLTHPDELRGDESAVLNSAGTLLFAHPTKPLDEGDWRSFFSGMDVIK